MQNRHMMFGVIVFVLTVVAEALAVNPAPDGCYPNFTTAEGCNALNSLTTGAANTAVGWYSLSLNTTTNYQYGSWSGSAGSEQCE